MDNLLIFGALVCEKQYISVTGASCATVGKNAAGDWRFFERLKREPRSKPSAAKLSYVLDWFADNWPDDADRPNCLLDHMALRQWEAANEYSCQANQPVPRIVVPCLSTSELIDGYCRPDCKMSKLTEVGRGSKLKTSSCCSEASLEGVVEQ